MHDARDRNQGVWIEHSDRLYVAAYSSVASLVVTFSGYFRKMDGTIIEWAQTVEPTSDRAVTAKTVFFGAGFLLSCVATLSTGNANRGQCYVRAQVQRGESGSAVKLQNVVGGYVTDDYSPSFPYGKIEGPLEGPGNIRNISGTNPAAGVEIAQAVPVGARWRVIDFVVTLVASADVANRLPVLALSRAEGGGGAWGCNVAITASQTIVLYWSPGSLNGAIRTTAHHISTPETLLLTAEEIIVTSTANLQAADNYGTPTFTVEEWIEA